MKESDWIFIAMYSAVVTLFVLCGSIYMYTCKVERACLEAQVITNARIHENTIMLKDLLRITGKMIGTRGYSEKAEGIFPDLKIDLN